MNDKVPETKSTVWHRGERALQEKIGVADRMEELGQRIIRHCLLDQHRKFYAQLPFIVLGSVDPGGDAWATLLAGKPGFLSAPTPDALRIDAPLDLSDPASWGMTYGDAIGLLGIEFQTRRRNRLNGTLRPSADGGLEVEVDQSFGNCPQYIQLRDYQFSREPREVFAGAVHESTDLDETARSMIEAADTFFVTSYFDHDDGRRQVDVSHRGGKTGFVRVSDDGTLTIPDFAGNLFFATLGNILENGQAGLVFVDFDTGDALQLSGEAEVILDSPEIAAFQGAERLWRFRARRVVRRSNALALRWSFQDQGWSPNSLMTGDWAQAAERLQAAELATQWRRLKVTQVVDESASIRSFHLRPDDGAGLIPHEAGQHLPIRIILPDAHKPCIRTYTLSVAPSDAAYRISVKREGAVSQYLHDKVRVGDLIEARAPTGTFTIDARERRPAVLLAGGVGITPLLAMLRHVVYEGLRTRRIRPTVLFQAARSKAERAFDQELSALVEAGQGAIRVVRILSDASGAEEGVDHDAVGRIDMATLSRFLPFNDYDFYLCGPSPFTQALYDGLLGYNIADGRIHAEAFGPSALIRTTTVTVAAPARSLPATEPVSVVFVASSKEARWTPEAGTLLELAEARGLAPEFSCRMGTCGTCHAKLLTGEVTYLKEPGAAIPEGEVLICCAVPAAREMEEQNRIQLAL
jgi:ferredoxin-NADP reductase/predicted pyridoxine 5'-phosphate oxidase superfamily flavin-nucleotide-binding protein